jgi:hypothetical protein
MLKSEFKYDVVISFSEEQKDVAAAICLALDNLGLATYYYPYNQEDNIGKDLEKGLKNLYGKDSKLALAILSEDYFLGKYTSIELKTILDRRKEEPDYFIPIVYKTTTLPDFLLGITYLQWTSDPLNIARTVNIRIEKKDKEKIVKASNETNSQVHTITIDRKKHASFLADQRTDPISKDLIRAGDRVVICEKCKTVFLKEVWMITLNGTHCGQKGTLKIIPFKDDIIEDKLRKVIRKINHTLHNFSFELLHTIDSGIPFNTIKCYDNKITFSLKIEEMNVIILVVDFKSVKVKQNRLVCKSRKIPILLLESSKNQNGITLNSVPQKEIGIFINKNDEEKEVSLEIFHSLLKEVISEHKKL